MRIKISEEDNQQVLKAHYGYLLKREILGDILQNGMATENTIQKITEETVQSKILVEQLKEKISLKYFPKNIKPQSYTFDFVNSEIEFI